MPDKELSGRSLDIAIAERVMGWSIHEQPDLPGGNDDWYAALTLPCVITHPAGGYWLETGYAQCREWHPSASIEAAMEVEDRIAELNLRKPYLFELGKIVAREATKAGEIVGYWHFTHATAEQRCRAALAAIENKE